MVFSFSPFQTFAADDIIDSDIIYSDADSDESDEKADEYAKDSNKDEENEAVGSEESEDTDVSEDTDEDADIVIDETDYPDETDSVNDEIDTSMFLDLSMLLDIRSANTTWYNNTDSEFTLNTADQLAGLANLVNSGNNFSGKTVKLGGDIDLSGYSEWTPIGDEGNTFAGTFDGDGHVISNLNISDTLGEYHALFGNSSGNLQNFTVSGTVKGRGQTGGVVAVGSGTISGVTSDVDISYSPNSNYIGGIIGDVTGDIVIRDCHNSGDITDGGSSQDQSGKVAGIAGRIDTAYTASITGCSNTGDISGYQYIAGIAGGSFGSTEIDSCYNSGSLTSVTFGMAYIGGITGKLEQGTVSNCYNIGDINLNPYSGGHMRAAGGIVGCEEGHTEGTAVSKCYNAGTINLNTSKMTAGSNFIYMIGNISGGNNRTSANTMSYTNCYYLEGCIPAQDNSNSSYQFWSDVFKQNPKAYDTELTIKCSESELKSSGVLSGLGSSFKDAGGDAYPILYWQTEAPAPDPVSSAITHNVSGGTATVNIAASAVSGTEVSFTVSSIEAGKQVKRVTVTDEAGAAVNLNESSGNYSFMMPRRAVSVSVILENAVDISAESYSIALPSGLDAIWNLSVDSTYYDSSANTVKAGASVTIVVEKAEDAATSSFTGVTVTKGGESVDVTAANVKEKNGANWYGEYTFTMPEGAVNVELGITYSPLEIYLEKDGTVSNVKTYTRDEMLDLSSGNSRTYFSGWSTEIRPFIGMSDKYVTFSQLLSDNNIEFEESDYLKVTAADGFSQTYAYEDLLGIERYYYSDILTNGKNASSKSAFEPILTITANMTSDANDNIANIQCDTLNTYRFIFGQSEDDLKNAVKVVDSIPKSIVKITVQKSVLPMDVSWYNTSDTNFTINNADQLRGFAAIVNGTADGIAKDNFSGKTVSLGADIVLAEEGLYDINPDVKYGDDYYSITVPQYVLKSKTPVWVPIGSGTATNNTDASLDNAFAGTFDGKGFTVSGIYTGTKDATEGNTATVQGLFGVVSGTIKNVTVSGCITGKMVLGGVVAHLQGGTIINCTNNAVVFADGGTTPNGNTENGVSRVGAAGGIAGNVMDGSSVTGCLNTGYIICCNSNTGGRTGGIIGLIDGASDTVEISCNGNTGRIDSYKYAGGIVGLNFSSNAPIDRCYNAGEFRVYTSGSAYAGGIAAQCNSNITNCYNTADYQVIHSGDKGAHIGGIVSDFLGTKVENCYDIGLYDTIFAINGSYGAICGTGYGSSSSNKLLNCYAIDTAIGEDITNECVTVKSADDLKSADMIGLLNGAEGEAFISDFTDDPVNGGYPILAWQAFAVKFNVTPEDAVVVLKDSTGAEITPDQEGNYTLHSDQRYSYTVSADGYIQQTGTIDNTVVSPIVITLLAELDETSIGKVYSSDAGGNRGELISGASVEVGTGADDGKITITFPSGTNLSDYSCVYLEYKTTATGAQEAFMKATIAANGTVNIAAEDDTKGVFNNYEIRAVVSSEAKTISEIAVLDNEGNPVGITAEINSDTIKLTGSITDPTSEGIAYILKFIYSDSTEDTKDITIRSVTAGGTTSFTVTPNEITVNGKTYSINIADIAARVEVADPAVSVAPVTDDILTGVDPAQAEVIKDAIKSAAEGAELKTNAENLAGITDAAVSIEDRKDTLIANNLEALKTTTNDAGLDVSSVKVIIQPILSIQPVEYTQINGDTAVKTLTFEISLYIRTVLAKSAADTIVLPDEAGTVNAIVIEGNVLDNSNKVTVTESIQLSIPLMDNFVPAGTSELFVKHKNAHYHKGTIVEDKVTFTSTDGLSPFTLMSYVPVAAQVGTGDDAIYYDTLQEAVDSIVSNGSGTITVLDNAAVAEVNTAKTITLVAGTPEITITENMITAGSSVDKVFNNGTFIFTAKSSEGSGSTGGSAGGGGSSATTYTVTAPSSVDNGKITVSPKSAAKDSTVTITATPDEGYKVGTITVKDKDGNEIEIKDAGNGKYTFVMPASKVEISATFIEDNDTEDPTDPTGPLIYAQH